jgi:hypothetical protein
MTVADLIVTMSENDISPGTAVLANLLNIAIKHREYFLIPGFQVDAAMEGCLSCERIFPVSVR